jgi:hypothetical protein
MIDARVGKAKIASKVLACLVFMVDMQSSTDCKGNQFLPAYCWPSCVSRKTK